MWLDWLVFCDCGFCLSALWCPLSGPTILLGFLWCWTWGIYSWPLLLTLDVGTPSWPPLLTLDMVYLLSEACSSSIMQLLHHIYSIKRIVWSPQLMRKILLITLLFVVVWMYISLTPGNHEYDALNHKRDFAINKDFDMSILSSWIIMTGPCNHKSSYKTGAGRSVSDKWMWQQK